MDPALITAIATFFTALNGWTVGTVIICIFVVPPFLGLVAVLKVVGVMAALKDEIRTKNEQDNDRLEAMATVLNVVGGMSALKDEIHTKNEQDNHRFEAMVALSNKQHSEFSLRYDNNVYLIKNWENMAGDTTSLVHLNTQAMTSLGLKFDQLLSIWTSDRNGRKQ